MSPTRSQPPRAEAPRRKGGFLHTGTLVADRIRKVGEHRGFAVTRLLTHWAEIAGPDIAEIARPVKIGYARNGLGATLTLLTRGASAPVVQMRLPWLRERVNACYGYNAISRIVVTQTAPTGFAEGQADFTPAPRGTVQRRVPRHDPAVCARAADVAAGVQDDGLRSALEILAQNVLSRGKNTEEGNHG
jgi:hypothetical protein